MAGQLPADLATINLRRCAFHGVDVLMSCGSIEARKKIQKMEKELGSADADGIRAYVEGVKANAAKLALVLQKLKTMQPVDQARLLLLHLTRLLAAGEDRRAHTRHRSQQDRGLRRAPQLLPHRPQISTIEEGLKSQ